MNFKRSLLFFSLSASALLAACGGGGSKSSSTTSNPPANNGTSLMAATDVAINPGGARATQMNVERLYVDSGPASIAPSSFVNPVYADIRVCAPGTNTCAIIDHMLVDTGSVGVRIMAEALPASVISALPVDTAGVNSVGQCLGFAQGVTWGGVRLADVSMGGSSHTGMSATGLRVQIVGDTDPAFQNVPASCTSQGTVQNTVAAFGANGILGVGLFVADCGPACTNAAPPQDVYYSCDSAGACSSINRPEASQVQNPVASFATHNNGVELILPEVDANGSLSADGFLVFGVNTTANNATPSNMRKISTNADGFFSTQFNGQTLNQSFIDSGSSVYIFPSTGGSTTIPLCSAPLDNFFCPTLTTAYTNVNTGNASETLNASVSIGNATNLFSGSMNRYAYSNLAATSTSLPNSFDYGLSFFFKRQVAVVIEGNSASGFATTGPAFGYTP